jgi:hypothetical protein
MATEASKQVCRSVPAVTDSSGHPLFHLPIPYSGDRLSARHLPIP